MPAQLTPPKVLPDHSDAASALIDIPGTPEFFAGLLEHIHDVKPNIPVDPVTLQATLLTLMAGPGRHMLLRTREEDVGTVQNLTSLILNDILSYRTHKYKIAPTSHYSPSQFLSTVFFSQTQNVQPTARQSSPFKMRAKRSRTYPLPAGPDAQEGSTHDSDANASAPVPHRQESNRRAPSRPSLRAPIMHSDPISAGGSVTGNPVPHPSADAELPHALVVSGLEYTSVPCHRALLHTLLERRVVLDELAQDGVHSWNLPDDFFLVYVCPWDPHERPAIHKSLLDKFALSATIGLHPGTRQAYASYLTSQLLPNQPPSSHTPPPGEAPSAPPPLPPNFLPRLRELSSATHVIIHPTLRLYMADLFSAARHYHELDGTLLGARAVNDAEALIRAHRVLGGGDAGASLVERTAALEEAALARMRSQSALSGTYETGPGGEADIDDARRVQVQLHWLDTDDATAPKQPSVSSRAHSFLERPADWLEEEWGARWDVSEVDVAKVMPRVMTHRLRVRDGPEDEIMSSVMFMAAGPRAEVSVEESGDGVTEFWRRRTVKDIIVKIISEV